MSSSSQGVNQSRQSVKHPLQRELLLLLEQMTTNTGTDMTRKSEQVTFTIQYPLNTVFYTRIKARVQLNEKAPELSRKINRMESKSN